MKILMITALFCFALHAPHIPNKQAAQADAASNAKNAPPITVANNYNPPTQTEQKSDSGPKWGAPVWGNIPDWILAVAGVLTLIGVFKQAVETKRAAVAAENSAKAADANIVYTHRPKLILRGIGLIPKAGTFIEMEDGSVHNSVPWEIQYVVANVGGTEATIAESNLTLTHINLTQDQQFPEFPPYSEQRDSMGVFSLEPGEYKERVVPVPEGGGVLLGMLRHSVRRGALHTAGTLYCLGFFQYVDGNGVSRRTAFFRHFDAQTERFRRDAYPETPENYDYAD